MGPFREQKVQLAALMTLLRSTDLTVECPKPASSTVKQRQRRLQPDEIDQLVAAYQAGASTYGLADQFGITRHTVAAHLNRRGVERH